MSCGTYPDKGSKIAFSKKSHKHISTSCRSSRLQWWTQTRRLGD